MTVKRHITKFPRLDILNLVPSMTAFEDDFENGQTPQEVATSSWTNLVMLAPFGAPTASLSRSIVRSGVQSLKILNPLTGGDLFINKYLSTTAYTMFTSRPNLFLRWYLYVVNSTFLSDRIMRIGSTPNNVGFEETALAITSTGKLQLIYYSGGLLTATTSATSFPFNGWHSLEVNINYRMGYSHVYLDGVEVLDLHITTISPPRYVEGIKAFGLGSEAFGAGAVGTELYFDAVKLATNYIGPIPALAPIIYPTIEKREYRNMNASQGSGGAFSSRRSTSFSPWKA